MKILLSPSKSLDFESSQRIGEKTVPAFLEHSEKINKTLRQKSPNQLKKLQSISDELAELNYERNQHWDSEKVAEGRQAALAFTGDVYRGLDATTWNEEDMDFASDKIVVLSGLYGMLYPTDAIMPYRLEMGTKLKVGSKKDLYEFWKKPLQTYVDENWDRNELIVNLASNEYFRALSQLELDQEILNVDFKDFSRGKYKVIPFFAKIARGLLARYIVLNRIENKEDIQSFNLSGYYFQPDQSSTNNYVFYRDKKD